MIDRVSDNSKRRSTNNANPKGDLPHEHPDKI